MSKDSNLKVVVAPDSFKGSLSASRVADIIKRAFEHEIPGVEISLYPMADGGEGTLEALLFNKSGNLIHTIVTGAMGTKIQSCYGIINHGQTIIIEAAKVVGLDLVLPESRNILLSTSFGIGELILEGINKGINEFIIALGGTAINDGGLGMLQALGVTFQDESEVEVKPIANSLNRIRHVDYSSIHPKVKGCKFLIASDVENPLCGNDGATNIFGEQKGATRKQLMILERGMNNFAFHIEKDLAKSFQNLPGAGAAGGLGFAFLTLGGEICSGARLVAESSNVNSAIIGADWVITGEGLSDKQTLYGKAPFYIGNMAKNNGIKAILISGGLGEGKNELLDYFVSCHSIVDRPMSLKEAVDDSEQLLFSCARNIARLIYNGSASLS